MANTYEQEVELQEMFSKRASFFEKMNTNLRGSLAIMQQMVKTMGKMTDDETLDFYENMNELMSQSTENVQKYGDTSEEAFEKIKEGLSVSQRLMIGMKNDLEKIGKRSMIWVTLGAGVMGFAKGLKFSFNAMGSFWNVLKHTAASLGHFAVSVISFPFKMLRGLMSLAQQGGGDNSLRQALEDIRKEFGDLRTGASAAIIDIARSMRGPLAETGLNARRIFGNLADALKFVQEYAHNMGPLFNLVSRQLTASADAAQRFGAYIKGLGLQDLPEAQKAIARMSITSGRDINELGREITSFAYQMGEAFGINGKEISRDVGKMMADFDTFGNLSIQTLTNVSVYARKLGVEVEKLKGIVSSFDDFEKAAEGAAHLSQAFGLNIDAFQMIQEQDPAARIDQLRKAFFAAGRSVENMTRQERALLAEQTGLDQETLSLVFAQKNASTSYADIQKQSEATKKKQLSQAEAMEKLANSIERMVKSGQGLQGGFFKIFLDGFTAGIMRSRDFRGLMRDLRQDMRIVFQEGRRVGRMFVDTFPGVRDMLGGLREIFNPSEWRRRMTGVTAIFKQFFGELGNPKSRASAFGNFVNNMRQHFSDLFNPQSQTGQRFLTGVRSFFTAFGAIMAAGFRFALKSITSGMRVVADLIRNPAAAMARLRAGAGGAAGVGGFFMQNFVSPIIETIVQVGPQLWDAIKDLFSALWQRIQTSIFPRLRQFGPGLIATFFGPAIISSITNAGLAAFGTVFARILVSGIGSIFTRLRAPASEQVARGVTGILSDAGTRVAQQAPRGNLAGAVSGASEAAGAAVGGANAVEPQVARSRITGASIGKALLIGTFMAVGLLAVIAGIVLLAGYIQRNGVSAASLAMSVGVFIAAAVVLGVVGTVASVIARTGPMAAGAAAAMAPTAMLLAGLAVVVGGLLLLTMAVRESGITIADITTTTALIGASVLTIIAAIVGGAAIMAAGLLTVFTPLLVPGLVTVAAFAEAMALASAAIAAFFYPINAGLMAATEAKVKSAGTIIIVTVAVGAAMLAAGIIGKLPGVKSLLDAGMEVLGDFASAIATTVTSIVTSINNMRIDAGIRDKVSVVTEVMSSIGQFIGNIGRLFGNTSVLSTLAGDTISDQLNSMLGFIMVLSIQMPSMVQAIVDVVSRTAASEGELTRAQSIAQIVSSIGQLIGNISRAVPENVSETSITLISRFFRRSREHIVALLESTGQLVETLVRSAGNLDPAKAGNISAISSAITTILSSIGGLFGTLLRSNAVATILRGEDPTAKFQQLNRFFSMALGALSTGETNFFTSIGNLVTRITQSANLDERQSANLYNISRILVPILGSIQSVMGVIGTIGPELLRGSSEEIRRRISGLSDAMGAIASGFSTGFSEMIPNLVKGIQGIDTDSLRGITGKVRGLQQVLGATNAMTEVVRNAGSFSTELQTLLTRVGGLFGEETIRNISSVQDATRTRVATVIDEYSQMVDQVNDSLRTIASRSNNLTVSLQRTRDRLGLSGRQRSSLSVGAVNVTINVGVTLSVDDIETAIATRPNGSTFVISSEPGAQRLRGEPGFNNNQVVTIPTATGGAVTRT